ncbi:hypothetical protein GCM10028786_23340 [Flaviaesturariibacter terrae]
MDLEALQRSYEGAMADLRISLLNDAPWSEVEELRQRATTLSITLHDRLRGCNRHPAAAPGQG